MALGDTQKCSFCQRTKKEIGKPIFLGKGGAICYDCVAEKKKELDEEVKKDG